MSTPSPRLKREGGIQHFPSNWDEPCQAKCRKTGLQCTHKRKVLVPSTIAGSVKMDTTWFNVSGRPVGLCDGHYRSWASRARRLLSLPLIEGGHLSPYNASGYGSVIIKADRIDFTQDKPKVKIPPAWGWIGWRGYVPEGLLERIPQYKIKTQDHE